MIIDAPKDITDCRRFFLEPSGPKQRLYEALRAFYVEGLDSQQAAERFGYTPGAFRVMCHHFRRDPDPSFFLKPQHGPQSQPKKSATRSLIVRLRKLNHSVYEISDILKDSDIRLCPTAVRQCYLQRYR